MKLPSLQIGDDRSAILTFWLGNTFFQNRKNANVRVGTINGLQKYIYKIFQFVYNSINFLGLFIRGIEYETRRNVM